MFCVSLIILWLTMNLSNATVSSSHVSVSSSTENVQTTTSFSKTKEKPSINICETEICMSESAKMLSFLDENIDPCNDFYEFACGKFIQKTVLQNDKNSQTTFSELQENVDAQLQAILTENQQLNEKSPFEIANIFMKSCIDEAALNRKGYCHTINTFIPYHSDVSFPFSRYFTNGGHF